MKTKMTDKKKNTISTLIVLLLLFVCAYSICYSIGIGAGDDMVYKDAFHDWQSLKEWAKLFLTTWGGRVIVLGVTSVLLNAKLTVYKVITTLAILTLVYAIYKMIVISRGNKKSNILLITIFSMLFLINQLEFSESIIWMTGSFNYLWTSMTLCIALIPSLKIINQKEIYKWEYILYIPAVIFTCNFEQTGAIFVCFASISFVIAKLDKIKINKGMIAITVMGAIVTIASLLAVGNSVRSLAETIRFYPDFDMLSITDKMFQGLSITLNHLFNNTTFIMLILSFELCYLLFCQYHREKTKFHKQQLILSFVPFVYLLMRALPLNQLFSRIAMINLEEATSQFYQYSLYNTQLISNPEALLVIALATVITISLAIFIYFAFENKKTGIVYAILYLAGLCASLIMGLSPTIFASSQRIFFVQDIMLITVTAGGLFEIISKKQYGNKERILLIAIILIAFLHMMTYNGGIIRG